jgi:hypothetical protein
MFCPIFGFIDPVLRPKKGSRGKNPVAARVKKAISRLPLFLIPGKTMIIFMEFY